MSNEKIVAQHLDTLIRHNIIKSVKKSNNGKVKRCQPPGMVFNHICGKAVIENFFTLLCGPSQIETAIQEYVRRLSLHPYLNADNGGLNVPNVRRLLTMVVFPTEGAQYGSILRFDQHKLLRVLDLKECCDLDAKHFPKICDMLLLKYLSLGKSIDCVPRKIGRLEWLETLDMRTNDVVTVYSELLKLPKLKHLLGKFQLASEDCPDKKHSVLKKGAKKIGLKDGFLELKKFLTKNSVLETLSGIFIGNGKGLPQLLSHMLRLRKVKIWCDSTTEGSTDLTDLMRGIKEFTSHQARMPNVDHSLSIDFRGSSRSFLYCLHGPGTLTSLNLCGTVTLSRPVNTALLISVQELCLSWTNLSGAQIQQALSNLRCQLKFMKLVEKKLMGLEIRNNVPFKDLERLCLVGEQSLERIIIQDLSKLVSLHLLCEALAALPGIQITSLRNLKEVGLHSEVHGDIKRRWEDAAKDHQRKPKVVSIEVETIQ
jgi:disease resistance protein RPM1